MNVRHSFWIILMAAGLFAAACHQGAAAGPRELLDRYFSSAVRQDYATAYDCYYDRYKAKVTKDEYIKHRKEASVLQSFKVLSLTEKGDTAEAQVQLTFAPSGKMKRGDPVSVPVKEDLVRENGQWKIKVWN